MSFALKQWSRVACRTRRPRFNALYADRRLRYTVATINVHALHNGLSSASLDKIVDGTGQSLPGYDNIDSGYREEWAAFCENPAAYVVTYRKAQRIGNIQPVLYCVNVSTTSKSLSEEATKLSRE
jgi:hypothetical protein